MDRMRIWISGSAGMMGSQLCSALLAAGHEVLASYYNPTVDPVDLADLPLEEVDIRDWCSVYDSLMRFRGCGVSFGRAELPGGIVAASDRDVGNQCDRYSQCTGGGASAWRECSCRGRRVVRRIWHRRSGEGAGCRDRATTPVAPVRRFQSRDRPA